MPQQEVESATVTIATAEDKEVMSPVFLRVNLWGFCDLGGNMQIKNTWWVFYRRIPVFFRLLDYI